MMLDAGTATIYRVSSNAEPGDMYNEIKTKLLSAWFGYRIVGFSRYFTAYQINARVDALIRILKPVNIPLKADDVCVLAVAGEPEHTYRIVQVQYLRDEDAGEDVADLSLERIGDKYDS